MQGAIHVLGFTFTFTTFAANISLFRADTKKCLANIMSWDAQWNALDDIQTLMKH